MAPTTTSDNTMVVAATDSNSYCNWKDLPVDLLYRILKFLRLTETIRFGAVCTDWYSVASHNLHPQPPFLLLAGDKTASSDLFQFFDLSTKKFYKIRLPQLLNRRCIGSSEGKVIYIDERAELHVLDPITGSHFDLPSITTFPGIGEPALDIDGNVSSYLYQSFVCDDPSHPWYEDPSYKDVDFFVEVYFFKVIICPKTSAIVLLRHLEEHLAICMPGDRSWTMIDNGPLTLESHGVSILHFMDVVFYKDGLYGVTYYGLFVSFVIGDDFKDAKFEVLGQPFHPMKLLTRYLVVVDDELFQVWRHDDYVDRDDVYEYESRHKRVTKKFEIYKMNWGNIQWVEVKSIGEHALFLGFNSSFSLSTRDFLELKANCIYFTDDQLEHLMNARHAKRNLGVYNIEDGTIEPCYPGDDDLQLNWPPPIWFIPKGLPCRRQRTKMNLT